MPAPKLFDRVRETTPTSGVGTYTLSGVAVSGGYVALDDVLSNTDKTIYGCVGLSGGVPSFEVGLGTYATPSPGTLARTAILSSSNANAEVSWDAGDKVIFICTAAAYSELDRMKHTFSATVAPTSSEDSADGYHAGSLWLDATLARLFMAVDDSGTWLQVLASRFARIDSAASGTAASISGGALLSIGVGAAATEDDAIAIGELAVADGVNSTVIGGYDNEVTSGGTNAAILGGNVNQATAKNSAIVGGTGGETIWPAEVVTGGLTSGGIVHASDAVLSRLTVDATPTYLQFDNDAAANGYMTVREGEALAIDGFIVARSTTNFSMWKIEGAIYRNAAGNVTIDDAFTVTMVSQTAGASTWAAAVSADTTNQQPKFDVTGAAATNITWGGRFRVLRVE